MAAQKRRTIVQTTIYKTLHRKLKVEQHDINVMCHGLFKFLLFEEWGLFY